MQEIYTEEIVTNVYSGRIYQVSEGILTGVRGNSFS